MAGLQRSGETFRRSGSSGLVWEDRFLPGEMDHNNKAAAEAAKLKKEEGRQQEEEEEQGQPGAELRQSHSTRGGGYRSRVSPAIEPPSPKASGCCFGIFGKPQRELSVSKPKPKPNPQHRPAATRR